MKLPKKYYLFGLALLLIIFLGIIVFKKFGGKQEENKIKELIVYFIVNNPKVVSENKEITNINIGYKLKKGDIIITDKNSMIGITEPASNTRIIIGKETSLLIEEKTVLTLNLKNGKTYNYINGKIEFYQKTPTLTIGVRGTRFVVISDENKAEVKLSKGKVQIKRNIVLPSNVKEEPEILEEGEIARVTKKENEEIQKEIGINILRLPKITREPISKIDQDIKELNDYEDIKLDEGILIIQDNTYPVFLNDKKIGDGNIILSLKEGEYRLRIEKYEDTIKIEKGKTTIIKPNFKKPKREEALKPIEPSKKPILEK